MQCGALAYDLFIYTGSDSIVNKLLVSTVTQAFLVCLTSTSVGAEPALMLQVVQMRFNEIIIYSVGRSDFTPFSLLRSSFSSLLCLP